MPQINGIELVKKVKQIRPNLPVLLTTDSGELSVGVKALKSGAFSILKKPLFQETFVAAVESALEEGSEIDPLIGQSLTQAEEEILELIIAGKGNKAIAYALHRSVRTIEWHRNRIMRKLNVDNIVDIVKTAVGGHSS